jgi:hypothetical protein
VAAPAIELNDQVPVVSGGAGMVLLDSFFIFVRTASLNCKIVAQVVDFCESFVNDRSAECHDVTEKVTSIHPSNTTGLRNGWSAFSIIHGERCLPRCYASRYRH